MRKAGTINPVILLDEIDKLGSDYRGDPASALLEVLDPAQNSTFQDHYLEVEYDLSNVLFLTTANLVDTIPRPLLDRMEVLRISGYTEEEKREIARRHLLPKVLKDHGLKPKDILMPEESMRYLIRSYTREAGVRGLERALANLARKATVRLEKKTHKGVVEFTEDRIREYLGAEKFRPAGVEEEAEIGVVAGLAWTEVGGVLLVVEANAVPGKGKLTLTGKLGEVMQESGSAALSYIRSRTAVLGIDPDFTQKFDMHVHLPEGAVPKDGPSAGITIATALVSALSGVPVRPDVAMTGEISLRGRVLKIGGLKEKALAAHRAGIFEVVIPEENLPDLEEIPEEVRKVMHFHPVKTMDQVLTLALAGKMTLPLGEPSATQSLAGGM